MFTVKVREERFIPQQDESHISPEINETIYEAKQVMLMQGNIVVDLVETNLMGDKQITYQPALKTAGYTGKIYVMNRYGATVATYDL